MLQNQVPQPHKISDSEDILKRKSAFLLQQNFSLYKKDEWTIEYVAQADEISIDLWYERYYEKGAGITISFFAFLEGKRKLKKARELIVFLMWDAYNSNETIDFRCLNKEETMLLELEYLGNL